MKPVVKPFEALLKPWDQHLEGEDSLEMEKLHVESVQDELLEAFEDFGQAEMLMDSMPMLKL